ncbi:MAG TPA: hypothetical protein VH643_07325 [Gemmataceae bacterium]|jgi:hypothetical protein
MRSIWGPVTEIQDLGVVAEQCPYCERVMPCLLRSVYRGSYIFFIKTAVPTEERSRLCTACLQALPCEHWRYAAVVPIRKAKVLPIEDLLSRTNPGLAERLQLREQIRALGGDAAFGLAYEQVERLRPGALRSSFLKQLLGWNGLAVEQRTLLGQLIGSHARACQFACQIAPAFPGQTGCWRAALAAFAVWSAFLWVPAVHSWLWGSITLVAGLVAAALTRQLLLTRNVCQWTRKVLIPEAQEANVSLACLLAVVEDVPGSRLGMMEDLWPIRNELEAIRRVLSAEGRL